MASRFILFLLLALLLNGGCYRSNICRELDTYNCYHWGEFIASFPIDVNSAEEQIFELNGVRVKNDSLKIYHKYGYDVLLCIDDTDFVSLTYNEEVAVGFKSKKFEKQYINVQSFTYNGESKPVFLDSEAPACKSFGWAIGHFNTPDDFDVDQTFILTFQIIKDKKKYLASVTNPVLILYSSTWSAIKHMVSRDNCIENPQSNPYCKGYKKRRQTHPSGFNSISN